MALRSPTARRKTMSNLRTTKECYTFLKNPMFMGTEINVVEPQ